MKLSYSTRGWYDMPFEDLISASWEMRFSGIEFYDLYKHTELFEKGAPLNKYNADALLRQLRDKGIQAVCLDTSVDLTKDDAEAALLWTIEKAGSFKVPFVTAEVMSDAEDKAKELIARLIPLAKDNKVCLLIKTKGIYADTKRLADMLDGFADDSLGVLWDMHHSFCDLNEPRWIRKTRASERFRRGRRIHHHRRRSAAHRRYDARPFIH